MKKVTRDNTKKKNIINNVYGEIGLPASYIQKIINDLIRILTESTITKKILKIKNFGTLKKKKKNKRIGRNPKNKKVHEISERNVVTFKPSEELKKKLNLYVPR